MPSERRKGNSPLIVGETYDPATATRLRSRRRNIAELSTESSSSRPSAEDVPQGFVDYVARNYSGEVVFSDPAWHAKRLWRAAMSAIPKPAEDVRPDVAGLATICCDLRSHGWLAAAAMIETLAGERDTDTKNLTIHKLVKEIAEYRADAERYRWLRDNAAFRNPESSNANSAYWGLFSLTLRGPTFDAAVDAARGASTKEVDRG